MTKGKPVNPRLPGRYGKMTAAEWDAEVAEFDRESLEDHGSRAPTKAESAQLRRARLRGRPVIGKGAKRITTTIEKALLIRADHYARQHGLTRAKLISDGIKAILRKTG
jgi:hypothetical protein